MDPLLVSACGFAVAIAAILGGIGQAYPILFGKRTVFDLLSSLRKGRGLKDDPTYLPFGTNRSTLQSARLSLSSYDNEDVIRELEKLQQRLKQQPDPELGAGDGVSHGTHPFDAAEILLVKGEALLYLGDIRAVSLFREVISLLEPFNAPNEIDLQKKEHFIGRAFNDIGYFYARTKDLRHAEREYKEHAIPRLRVSESVS